MQGECLPSLFILACLCCHLSCSGGAGHEKERDIRFTDVASEAGIDFVYRNAAGGRFYFVETVGSGCALFDYDEDGDLDIYAVNGAELPGFTSERELTNVLYRNNGEGTFTDVSEMAGVGDLGYGMGCAVADYDNDGDPDLYVTNFGPNVLYRNNGDGTFTDVTRWAGVGDTKWATSAAFVDYDNDGQLDLYVINYVVFSLDKNKVCAFQGGLRDYCHPGNFKGAPAVLYRNNGDGTFTDVTRRAGVVNPLGKGMGVVFGDYDNDGDQDLYIANDAVRNFLYRNNGDGTFTDVTMFAGVGYNEQGKTQGSMGVDFGDYDNDGDLDIFVAGYSYEANALYRNNGDGTFTDVTFMSGLGVPSIPHLGMGTNLFDCDNDGDLDIYLANGNILIHAETPEQDQLLRNNGQGYFTDVSSLSGESLSLGGASRGAAFGDYDGDGDVDVFVINCNQRVRLLCNEGGNGNHWVRIRLIGTVSNRDGVGARITVRAGSSIQMEEVRGGSGFLSANDVDLHPILGLGRSTQADKIEIRWPSGIVQTLRDVPGDRTVLVREDAVPL